MTGKISRRTFISGGLASGAVMAFPKAAGATGDLPLFRFVSVPDFLNADIGRTGVEPDSINETWEVRLDEYLSLLAAEGPAFVLVAGDLVEGHWHRDTANVERFGPMDTMKQKKRAVRAAGELYYSQWLDRFDRHGLVVHAALGDHEVGDDPWRAGKPKVRAFNTYKDVWADHFTRRGGIWRYPDRPIGTRFESTAYGFRHGNLYVMTVDMFVKDRQTKEVEVDIRDGQLAWIEDRLALAEADPTIAHVIVQGHTPVLGPVERERSSNLSLKHRDASRFWRLLTASPKVKLYLCGEVHAYTQLTDGGVTQVSHGAVVGRGSQVNYIVGEVYADRIDITAKRAPQTVDWTSRLWCTDNRKGPASEFSFGEWSTIDTFSV